MRLEQQLLYEPRIQERQRVYTIVDLESLSASALYGISGPFGGSGPLSESRPLSIEVPKIGMELPGGLTIKDITKNTITLQEDFGGVGNIYTAHPDGGGATRFYGLGKGKARETKDIWKK